MQGCTGRADAARVEEAALNATAVPEQILYDGWLPRWAASKVRRARSINVIGVSRLPLDEKLAFCQGLYARAGQPMIFRITSSSPTPDLDAALGARSYHRTDTTDVMTAAIPAHLPAATPAGLGYELISHDAFAAVTGALRAYALEHIQEHARRLQTISVPTLPLLARTSDGTPAAAGLAVIEGPYAGLFDLVVDARMRRRGYGRALARNLMARAHAMGAGVAYLQVEAANTTARTLYESLGFTDLYAYWYRVPPNNCPAGAAGEEAPDGNEET